MGGKKRNLVMTFLETGVLSLDKASVPGSFGVPVEYVFQQSRIRTFM